MGMVVKVISALYDKLHKLNEHGQKEEYEKCLAMLRVLQNKEAQEMHERFKKNFPIGLDTIDVSLGRADALIKSLATK